MVKYVLGFIFYKNTVLLVRKKAPKFMFGYLNGVGGKIEPDETSIQAMVRETHEETGIVTSEADWDHILNVSGDTYHIVVYCMRVDTKPKLLGELVEEPVWVSIGDILSGSISPFMDTDKNFITPRGYADFVDLAVKLYVYFDISSPLSLTVKSLAKCCDCGDTILSDDLVYTCTTCQHTYCERCMEPKEMNCFGCTGPSYGRSFFDSWS